MGDAKPQVPERFQVSGVVVTGGLIVAVLFWSMTAKGVWYDELWSKWMASRELGVADAARQLWFHDVHPPLFYLYSWTLSGVIGPEIVAHRLINLLWLAIVGSIGLWLARQRPAIRPALLIAALLLLSDRDIVMFGEYRSYALSFCSTAILLLLLWEMVSRGREMLWRADRTLVVLLVVDIVLALNLHYITTLICGVTIGIFSLDRARLGQWRWVALLMGVAVIAMLPVFGALWAQRAYMAAAVPNFWVTTSFAAAFKMMGGKVFYAAGLNIFFMACLALELRRRMERRATGDGAPQTSIQPEWHFAILAAVSVAASCVILLAINVVRPVIEPRYLIALSPIAIIAFAAVAADRIMATRWLFVAFLVNVVVVALFFAVSIARKPAWDEAARSIATVVRGCPGTIVYTMWRMEGVPIPIFTAPPNERAFMTWAMSDIGRTYGFSPKFINTTRPPTPLAMSGSGCPTVLWVEHAVGLDGAKTAAAAGLGVGAARGATLRTSYTKTGSIIILSPGA